MQSSEYEGQPESPYPNESRTEPAKPSRWVKEIKEWTLSLGVAIIAALLIHNFAIAQTEVEMNSMENTLYEGERLIEDKITYRFSTPDRGDIVIINGPEYENRLVKRLIGLPGDVIDMREGYVYLNDEQLNESYAKGLTYANGLGMPYTIPEDHYFVLGDNREISLDSRQLGAIHEDSIEGRIIYRIWPFEQFGKVD
ncbi:signal peptidase I [Marinicrinis sediminis]|uniref:Signal peptidase I n=1 Tax=Marinicrinis sediminis TaxID=1652465 RepID=A0ABW5RDM0_9BACL